MKKQNKSAKTSARKIFYFGYPEHGNLGDHAIALASINYLKKFFPDSAINTISVNEGVIDFLTAQEYKKSITDDDIIVITGGGNMGNQYIGEEYLRQLVIKSFPKNNIISFPQTIHFVDNGKQYREWYNYYLNNTFGIKSGISENDTLEEMIDEFKNIYSTPINLYLFAREEHSYNTLKNFLSDTPIYYAPDIVLSMKKSYRNKRNGVGLCLRQDTESVLSDANRESIFKSISEKYNTTTFDTVLDHNLTKEEGKKEVENILERISKCEVLVTDRLHGLIFAAITGTPCVVLSNSNHKVKGTYEILKKHKNIVFCDDINNLLPLIETAICSGTYKIRRTIKNEYKALDLVLTDIAKDKRSSKLLINPKISICIPVYNVEQYLIKCLDSVTSQTYKNLEIICVEDGSTDNSAKLLDDYAKKDPRIKVIKHPQNKGLLAGRKTAVDAATGHYIMFVDSDDTIVPNACEMLAKEIESKKPDIIAFDCNVVNFGTNNEQSYNESVAHFKCQLKPGDTLIKEEISKECFINEKFTFNVWNKIYKTEICKKVYPLLPNKRIVWAEDLFASQYLMYYAKNMVYLDKKLYNYSFGIGVSTIILDWSKHINNFFIDLEFITTFQNHLKENGDEDTAYYKASEVRKNKTINWILHLIVDVATPKIAVDILNKLLDMYGISLLANLRAECNTNYEKIAKIVPQLNINKAKAKKVQNIGIFYHRIGNGGVERVIQNISPLLFDAGYNVTLFITEKTKDDYEIDKRINIEVIPSIEYSGDIDNTKDRYDIWKGLIEKYNIDTMMYQASFSPYMLYDMLFCKMMGVYFVTTAHELYSQEMCNNNDMLKKRILTIQNVDFIQTLSRTEETFWKTLGVNAKYIPNPLTFNPQNNKGAKKKDKLIVWVGRLQYFQKKPRDAIDIMSIIHQQDKDVRMIMLGKGENEQETNDVLNYINEKGLKGVIENVYDNDIKKYYEKASLLLSTSTYESFSLVLAEAMSFGLPCVIYDMPYLELVQENKGVVSVGQRDIQAAAQAILALLNNKELLDETGLAGKEFIEKFTKLEPMSIWKETFKALPNYKKDNEENKLNKIMLETIFDHYTVGIREMQYKIYWITHNASYAGNRPLTKLERLARSLAVNGVFKTIKKVMRKVKNKIIKPKNK